MRGLALAVVAAALLAGCAQHQETQATSGPGTPTGPGVGGPGNGTRDATHLLREVPEAMPISVDGSFGNYVCAPSGPDSCVGAGSGQDSFFPLPYAGAKAFNGTVTLTWTTQNPALQKLGLVVGLYESCGQGCFAGTGGASMEGTSPVTVTLPRSETTAKTDGVYISVYAPRLTPSPVYAQAQTDTPFHVEGRLTATVMK